MSSATLKRITGKGHLLVSYTCVSVKLSVFVCQILQIAKLSPS